MKSKCGLILFFLADTVSPLISRIKSASFSTHDNGDSERSINGHRRPSVLDEKALREADTKSIRDQRIATISRNYQGILESIGEDPSRQGKIIKYYLENLSLLFFLGLLKTPKRAAEVDCLIDSFPKRISHLLFFFFFRH